MNQEFSFQWGRGGCQRQNRLGMEWESTPGNFAWGESVETRGGLEMEAIVTFWVFPEGDFAAWRVLVGTAITDHYQGYIDLVEELEEECRLQGGTPVRVHFSLAEMVTTLAANDWANTPDNRAAVVGLKHLEEYPSE